MSVRALRITTRNARFQQWLALRDSRTKRTSTGGFLVQGVRSIDAAIECGWSLSAVIFDADRPLSAWARDLIAKPDVEAVAMSTDLLQELGGKTEDAVEVVAVVRQAPDDLSRIRRGEAGLVLVLDRPASPGNIGTVIRSADVFGASGVIVVGHAADVYDPKTIRASVGSFFAVPVIRAQSPHAVLDWARRDPRMMVVGMDEDGTSTLWEFDFKQACLLVVGNERRGLSSKWRDSMDRSVRIPMSGRASSLNAASAATVALYEASRQRGVVS